MDKPCELFKLQFTYLKNGNNVVYLSGLDIYLLELCIRHGKCSLQAAIIIESLCSLQAAIIIESLCSFYSRNYCEELFYFSDEDREARHFSSRSNTQGFLMPCTVLVLLLHIYLQKGFLRLLPIVCNRKVLSF